MKNILNKYMVNLENYKLDLNAIIAYCTISHSNDTAKKSNDFRQQEITNNYQLNENDELELSEKQVHEVITPQLDTLYDEFKSDLVNKLLQVFIRYQKNDMLNIVTNTFISMGFLVEKNNEN